MPSSRLRACALAFVLLLLAATLAGAAAPSGGEGPASKDEQKGHGKLSPRLRERPAPAAARDEGAIAVTVLASPGVAGHQLARVLRDAGAEVGAVGRGSVDARVAPALLDELARRPEVGFVDLPHAPEPAGVTSEGASSMRASDLHALGRRGAGVKVAVVDIGFDPTHPEIAHRVRGNVTFDGQPVTAGPPEHGTACAEIVLDVAPEADLHLVRVATLTEMELALDWAVDNGMDVVSMSLGTALGPFDGSSALSQALTRAAQAGVLVAVSSGNSARHHWHGAWSDPDGDRFLDFASPDETLDVPMAAGQTLTAYLSWNAYPTTDQDYDLHLYDEATTTRLASSQTVQSGTQPPWEVLTYTATTARTVKLAVERWSATGAHEFHLFLGHNGPALGEHRVAARSLTRPSDALGAISVGAADWQEGHALHAYSSQGPTDDGRTRPHLVAAAGVTTSTYGFQAYYGTSASAPHVAGVLALLRAERPTLTRDEAVDLLARAARDLAQAGPDNATGHGWADARSALLLADATPPSVLSVAFDPPGPRGAGPVDARIRFDDHLGSLAGATVRLAPASGEPTDWTILGAENDTLLARGAIGPDTPNGLARLLVAGVQDWASNPMPAPDNGTTLLVDTQAPLLAPLAPDPHNGTQAPRPLLRARATDPGAGLDDATFRARLDGAPLAPARHGDELHAQPSAPLAPGDHAVSFEAADHAGNPAWANWTLHVAPPPQLQPLSATLRPGATAPGGLDLADALRVRDLHVEITYNGTLLRLRNATPALPAGSAAHVTLDDAGRLTARLNASTPLAGDARLLNWTLEPLITGRATTHLTLRVLDARDDAGDALAPLALNATLRIAPKGDVSGDGRVTGADALLIRQYVVGNRPASQLHLEDGDVTGDGRVTGADALLIAQYVVGKRTTL